MPGKQGNSGQNTGANGRRDAAHERPTAHDEEQLSAYLDGELSGAERAALERRLTQDVTLQRALGELRQTRALLQALPAPALPHSFALPEVGALEAPKASARTRGKANRADDGEETTGALRTMPRVQVYRRDTGTLRAVPRSRTARIAQALGSLVAVLGLALLLTATLPAHAPSIFGGAGEPSSANSPAHTAAGATTHAPSSPAATSRATGTYGANTIQHTASPSANTPTSPTPAPTTAGASTAGGGGSNTSAPVLAQTWLSALGVLLLVGGVILFAYGRFARPRR